MKTTTFKTAFASVRPPRVATLLDRNDPDWEHTCMRVIEFYSSVWGGKYNIIVPTDGATILPEFWKLLELYDPDYCFSYTKTWGDLKFSDPGGYDEMLQARVGEVASGLDATELEQLKGDIDGALQRSMVSNFRASNELESALIERLAVFHHENRAVQSSIYADTTAAWQLTKLADVLPACEHADKIAVVKSLPDGLQPLWLAAVTGSCNDATLAELTGSGLNKFTVEFSNQRLSEVIRLGVKGYHDVDQLNALRKMLDEKAARVENLSPYFPFQISAAQLATYLLLGVYHSEEANIVIVGETLDDFAFYFCLSRLRPNVSWLRPSWVEKHEAGLKRVRGTEEKRTPEESIFSYFSLALTDSMGYGNRTCTFASLSLSSDEVAGVVKLLPNAAIEDIGKTSDRMEIRTPVEVLPTHPWVAFETDNVNKPSALQFVDKELPGWFETPKPRNFRKVDPSKFRWITEIRVKGHAVPRHPLLGPSVIRDSRLGSLGVRAGRNGVSYYCPNMMVLSGLDLDQLLIKPSIHLPEALDIFQALAEGCGYSCTPSQKGVFAQEATRRFGNLPALAAFLRNPSRSTVLDKFLDSRKPSEGEHNEGVWLTSDRRRYLDIASIRKMLGRDEDDLGLIDELVVKGVLHRGFIFKCRLCRNADWFSVEEVSSRFKCKRCGLDQTYVKGNVLRDGEPSWFYKLDELVLRAHQNGFAVPILALDYMRKQSKETFLFTHELDIFSDNGRKPFIEIDICCVSDGLLTIGEAKKSNRLEKTVTEEERTLGKYRSVAEKLKVGQVVFATAENTWSEETAKRIERTFSSLPLALTLIGRAQLFS